MIKIMLINFVKIIIQMITMFIIVTNVNNKNNIIMVKIFIIQFNFIKIYI